MASSTIALCQSAKGAAGAVAALSTQQKNEALRRMADRLEAATDRILAANKEDLAEAADHGINEVMADRLRLTPDRIKSMADGLRALVDLPDPVGQVERTVTRPNGISISKVRAPLGVIAIIYESRPNVTSDAAGIAFKAGSACILRGGKESYRSSKAVVEELKAALKDCSIPEEAIGLVSDLTHASADELMTATGLVDLLVPRGGSGLIQRCVQNAKVPCIQTGSGICHIYVDDSADLEKAVNIVNNAKTQRPSVCNAEDVCLVHKDVAADFLPRLKARLVDRRVADGLPPVELRLDACAAAIIDGTPAGEQDFDTEFLDYILAIKVVENVKEAIGHIAMHSTGHSESILTANDEHAALFTQCVDSAAVYVNASTRFTDGGEFGLGCEMGIATQKLHARGPMGLEEMTTYKYIIRGTGQIRE